MTETEDIRVRLEQESDFSFRVTFQGTALESLLTDEASPLGHDRGPDPSRLLLAAISNCLAASLLFALRKYRNDPAVIVAEASAQRVRNPKGRWRIPKAFVELHLPGHTSDYVQLERILDQFEDFCIVTQSVRHGVDVQVTIKDGDGRVLRGDKTFEAGA